MDKNIIKEENSNQEMVRTIKESIKSLQILKTIYASKEGWIIESKNHVNVGDDDGLNGTAFAVKSPMTSKNAKVWATEELAEKYGADYFLVDGNNKPIRIASTKAYDFFNREIETYKKILVLLTKNK